jgi:hypothetical protein
MAPNYRDLKPIEVFPHEMGLKDKEEPQGMSSTRKK